MSTPTKPWVQPTREEIIDAVLDILENRPSLHDQGSWITSPADVAEYSAVGDVRRYVEFKAHQQPGEHYTPAERDDDPKGNMCGTRACAAGLTVIVGANPLDRFAGSAQMELSDGRTPFVSTRAAELLGLDAETDDRSEWLFAGNRSRAEVIEALHRLRDDPDAQIYDISLSDDPDDDEDEDEDPEFTVVVQVLDSGGRVAWERRGDLTSPADEDYSALVARYVDDHM